MSTRVLEVSCDESGAEGEKLFAAGSTVFALGSVTLPLDEATEFVKEIRTQLRAQGPELKARQLLDRDNHDVLEWFLTHPTLKDKGSVALSEKNYFLTGKLVDLVIEEQLHALGENTYRDGRARNMALALYREAPDQLGILWDQLLDQFNSMIRVKVRTGDKATIDDVYQTIDSARTLAEGRVAGILRVLHAGREHAQDFVDKAPGNAEEFLSLDPLFVGLAQAARTWHEKSGSPILLRQDQQTALTSKRVATLVKSLNRDFEDGDYRVPGVPVRGLQLVDSKRDPRIQVADLLAGAGRYFAEASLAGTPDPLVEHIRPFVDRSSVWGDDRSWTELTGQALP